MTLEQTARGQGTVFDTVAADYDRTRPTYPDELVDRACELAGLGSGDRVLEVGCGSGQLTGCLLARGLDVTAIEPGENLIALAVQRLGDAGALRFINARFEEAELPPERFCAVFSAAAFHWIDPDVSWERVARALVPGGTLALLQHCGLNDERSRADQEALLSSLARIAPEIAATWPAYRDLDATLAGARERGENVSEVWAWVGSHNVARPRAGRLFEQAEVAAVASLTEHTADEVNGLLRTISAYQRLSQQQRDALERENVALHERLGRPIRSSTVAVLVTARTHLS